MGGNDEGHRGLQQGDRRYRPHLHLDNQGVGQVVPSKWRQRRRDLKLIRAKVPLPSGQRGTTTLDPDPVNPYSDFHINMSFCC